MEQIELTVEERDQTGTAAARRLRKQGFIPANLHGIKNKVARSLSLNAKEFFMATRSGTGSNSIFMLNVSGQKKPEVAVVKEIQRDPVKGFVRHVDFLHISLKEKISVSVPIHLTGQAIGVKEGGAIQHLLHSIDMDALPMDLPDHIDLDISNLNIGDSLPVSALKLADSVEIKRNAEDVIVMIVRQTVSADETAAEEGEEGASSIEPEVASRAKEKDE